MANETAISSLPPKLSRIVLHVSVWHGIAVNLNDGLKTSGDQNCPTCGSDLKKLFSALSAYRKFLEAAEQVLSLSLRIRLRQDIEPSRKTSQNLSDRV